MGQTKIAHKASTDRAKIIIHVFCLFTCEPENCWFTYRDPEGRAARRNNYMDKEMLMELLRLTDEQRIEYAESLERIARQVRMLISDKFSTPFLRASLVIPD